MVTKIYTRSNIDSNAVLELSSNWEVSWGKKPKTLQYFITSRCNKRCPDCFFEEFLGTTEDISLQNYKNYITKLVREQGLEKVNLLGGEPTLHPNLKEMLRFNHTHNLTTHIYTNGTRLNNLSFSDLYGAKIRLSILSYDKDKPVTAIKTDLPLTILLPLKKDNIMDVSKILDYCRNLNVSEFIFSTIKKLNQDGDFFEDKAGCLSVNEYIDFLNSFFNNPSPNIGEYHINSRGIFDLGDENKDCNFINNLVDSHEINCPFDIDIKNISGGSVLFGRGCSKNEVCLLEKIVVKKTTS